MPYADFTSGEIISSSTVEGLFNDLDTRLSALEGVAFSAYGSTPASESNLIPASTTYGKIVCDTEDLDTAAAYNTTDARWTPNVAGTYLIGCVLPLLDNIDAGEQMQAVVYKNGTAGPALGAAYAAATGRVIVSGLVPVALNGTTDYVELWALQTGVSARRWLPGTNNTRFFGYLINAD